MTLNSSRTLVSALHTRLTGAFASPLTDQFDRRRRRHAESAGGASTAHPLNFYGPNNAKTKIRRERFGHTGWPSLPAPAVNHDLPPKGIPSDSARSENAVELRICERTVVRFTSVNRIAIGSIARSLLTLIAFTSCPWGARLPHTVFVATRRIQVSPVEAERR